MMLGKHTRAALPLSLAVAMIAVGCGEDDPPVEADFVYQVTCDSSPCDGREPVRNVVGLDGENGLSIQCAASNDTLTFEVQGRDEEDDSTYRLQVFNAGATDCRVLMHEGGNLYEGTCSRAAPTPTTPCQVDFNQDGSTVNGSIRCEQLSASNSNEIWRSVAAMSTSQPAPFTFQRCG